MVDVETAATPTPATLAIARTSLAQCEAFRPSSPKDIAGNLLAMAQLKRYLLEHDRT
jgi:hypothetical protein